MPALTRNNERSWAITLISDINIMLRSLNLRIAQAGGEATISTGNNNMFPDVLLYGDQSSTNFILQGWELKLPDTSITDEEFIKDAQRKARSLGLNSCFIWNFNAGVLYVKDDNNHFVVVKQWNDTNHIRTRDDVQRYRDDWLPVIRNILLEINTFLITGAIRGSELGDIIADNIIATIIQRNKLIVSSELRHASTQNAVIGAYIDVWWNDIADEFASDESNRFDAYSKVLLLNWCNRIVFAHLIKYSHNEAMRIDSLNFDTPIIEANSIFEQITSSCDFYSVFVGMEYNDIVPEGSWKDLMELNMFLTSNGLNNIEQTSLQTILENTVTMSRREVNGQFTTPTKLAEILARLTVRNWNGNVLDPCCGTGSIPKAVLTLKNERTNNIRQSIETTWASDKYSFPLQIANISLTGTGAINIPNRIFQHNVYSLTPDESIYIVDPDTGEQMELRLPLFDAIISNFPFIPFEKISNDDLRYINSIINMVRNDTGETLNGRSDYYYYIIFSLWRMLSTNGRLGIITSNSWLGTEAGKNLFKIISYYYNIEQVHLSNKRRWFNNAMVVTTITILSKKPSISIPSDESETVFCKWNMSLEELDSNRENEDILVNSSILVRELNENVIKMKSYSHEQIKTLQDMNVSLSALFHDISWLIEIREKLRPIGEVFKVIRGERRGWDAMFYPEGGHGIETRYIRNVLKNSRSITSLTAVADCDAFCCSRSIEELEADNHIGALSWINRFSNGVNQVGRSLPLVLARANMHWYEMSDANVADIVTTMNPDRRLFYAKFEQPSFINQRLIGLTRRANFIDLELYHALLNSLLGMFYIEAVGFGRGLGALDISSTTIKKAFMLNPELITINQRNNILTRFAPLLNREIYTTDRELNEPDRIAFEHEVLSSYGIDAYYDAIKDSLLSMQRMRLSVR